MNKYRCKMCGKYGKKLKVKNVVFYSTLNGKHFYQKSKQTNRAKTWTKEIQSKK